jgi:hypothetical protein
LDRRRPNDPAATLAHSTRNGPHVGTWGVGGLIAGPQGPFFRDIELMTLFAEAKEERILLLLRHQPVTFDWLIFDEFEDVPVSKTGAEFLADVIAMAYERSGLVVTANLLLKQ